MAALFRVVDATVRGNLRQGARALSTVSLADPTYIVWSPNTDIGKTIICGGLAKAAADCGVRFLQCRTPDSSAHVCAGSEDITAYTKPVQTGFPGDSDGRLVSRILGCDHTLAPHASYCEHGAAEEGDSFSGKPVTGLTNTAATLYAWKAAVSPHLAVRLEGRSVTDRELCQRVETHVVGSMSRQVGGVDTRRFGIVETAGGVCSPTPAGSRQVDVLRNLRMPGVLVADPRLGGISTTLSALDSLTMQGHDIAAIAIMDTGTSDTSATSSPQLDNADAISEHVTFAPGSTPPQIFQLPPLGPKPLDSQADEEHIDDALAQWLVDAAEPLKAMHAHLRAWHERRVARLVTAPAAARSTVWWPFTQHKGMTDGSITLIDSRVGEHYSVVRGHRSPQPGNSPEASQISETTVADLNVVREYDGCASWWTQGVSGELQPAVQRQMAYAAGRYMHVIFPEAIHEPALALSERLLASVGRGWAGKVFFSDDGSTAVEVALKMAFKKYSATQGLSFQSPEARFLQVVALTNGYHGDTLGVMDCCPRSVFNELQTPWYNPRGLFLEPPTCGISCGRWEVRVPPGISGVGADEHDIHDTVTFESMAALYSPSRRSTALAAAYTTHVEHALNSHEAANVGGRVGACLLEPGMQGAGGMLMLDPLFQNVLARVCQARGIPVIADEVFSGLWRLGAPSAAAAAGITPDIACYAKLLTAGSVPLAVTLASDDVFHAFDGDSKAQALLHGHSYTAHPVGCQVGLASLDALGDARYNPNIQADGNLRELWPQAAITSISHNPAVERVVPLGTVLAVDLKVAQGGAGYSSGAARAVCTRMRSMGLYARPLGNVAYIMCTPTTSPEDAQALVEQLETCLMETARLNDQSSSVKKQATA